MFPLPCIPALNVDVQADTACPTIQAISTGAHTYSQVAHKEAKWVETTFNAHMHPNDILN